MLVALDGQKKLIVQEAIEFLHFAVLEAIDGNLGELETALEILEMMREEQTQ